MAVPGYVEVFIFMNLPIAPVHRRRLQVLHIGNLSLLAFNLGCAFAPTVNTLIAFRFLGKFSLPSGLLSVDL